MCQISTHIAFVLKGKEINQIIALCIFLSNTKMLEELSRTLSQARVGGRLEDSEIIVNEFSFLYRCRKIYRGFMSEERQ